jgi:hypothetical protein
MNPGPTRRLKFLLKILEIDSVVDENHLLFQEFGKTSALINEKYIAKL